jgi:hypothetical protein
MNEGPISDSSLIKASQISSGLLFRFSKMFLLQSFDAGTCAKVYRRPMTSHHLAREQLFQGGITVKPIGIGQDSAAQSIFTNAGGFPQLLRRTGS